MSLANLQKMITATIKDEKKKELVEAKEEVKSREELLEDLEHEIKEFYEHKKIVDMHKKFVDKGGVRIKELMAQLNLESHEVDGYTAIRNVSIRKNLVDNLVVAKMKELELIDCIKFIEVPDEKNIEDMIYNNLLPAEELLDCMEEKEVVSLKVKFKE